MKLRARTSSIRCLIVRACGVTMLLALASCAGTSSRVADASADGDESGVRAGEQGAGSGVEIRVWVVDPAGAIPVSGLPRPGLRNILARYEGQTGSLSPSTIALWRSNGLRVMVVPRSELDALGESLNRIGPLQTQWLGESLRWIEAMRGPSWSRRAVLDMDNGPLDLTAGSMRMLLRAWVAPEAFSALAPMSDSAGQDQATLEEVPAAATESAPMEKTRAAVQVELMPQFLPSATARRESALVEREMSLLEARQEGVAFPRLLLETLLPRGTALIVVPASPQESWSGPAILAEPAETPTAGLGPLEPRPPSLGEAMLTDAFRSEARGTRVVLVIVPHAPREFRMRAY